MQNTTQTETLFPCSSSTNGAFDVAHILAVANSFDPRLIAKELERAIICTTEHALMERGTRKDGEEISSTLAILRDLRNSFLLGAGEVDLR